MYRYLITINYTTYSPTLGFYDPSPVRSSADFAEYAEDQLSAVSAAITRLLDLHPGANISSVTKELDMGYQNHP